MKTICATCGVVFSSEVLDFRNKDGKDFWCPNGHCLNFRSAIAKRKAERKAARAERKAREETEQKEVADLEKIFNTQPTPMQRLRKALDRSWKEQGPPHGDT